MMSVKNKKLLILLFVPLIGTFVLILFCGQMDHKQDKIGVVVSMLPLADFVEHVGKKKIEVTVMVPPGASPHSYEPKPDQLKKVGRAKMFIKAGSGVEFELVWMDKLTNINKDMMVVNSSRGIKLMEKDPHVWLSPMNAKKMVENICAGLIKLDPKNREYYKVNMNEYLRELDEIDGYIRQELEGIENRKFIVYHPAWGYFARDYNLEQIPAERAGKEPTAEEIKNVVEKAKEFNNKVVFVSPQFGTKGAETIAKEIGGSVIFIDPLPRSYISDMQTVVGQLVQAMR